MDQPPRVRAKGTGYRASVTWMRGRCGGEKWRRVMETFTPRERAELDDILAGESYALDVPDKLYRGFARVCCGDDLACAREAFRELGGYIAEDDLSGGVYSAVLKLLRPGAVARFLPRQWELYFPGVRVTEQVDMPNHHVVNTVRGLGGLAYISPTACGWITRAFEMVGASDVVVEESEFDEGKVASDELHFDVTWS